MISYLKLGALVGGLTLALAACGNQPDQGSVLNAIKGGALKKSRETSAVPTAEELSRNIGLALKNTDKRLAIAVVENRNSFTFLTEVANNGAYSTWGSPDRRTISEKNGVVTATRGLGADLMSAEVSNSLALIVNRRSGNASRTHVYLNGENQEQIMQLTCSIKVLGAESIAIGEISGTVTVLDEECSGPNVAFENTYKVTPSGRIVQSRQWLGPVNGYLTIQKLR